MAVSNFKGLISGYSWNGFAPNDSPVFVSYHFMTNSEVPSKKAYQPYDNNGYSSFNAAQQKDFEKALAVFEKTAGIKFVEVDEPGDAMINVMNTKGSSWGGWANYGNATSTYTQNGYLVIDESNVSNSYGPGDNAFEVILHELGHAMGLKHPFEGNPKLKTGLDNEDHTLMSYTSNGKNDSSLKHLDKDALQSLYGDTAGIRKGFKFDYKDGADKFVLKGTNNKDVLLGIDSKNKIDGKGGKDYVAGRDANDKLKGGTGNDKMLGGGGKDKFVFANKYDKDKIFDFQDNQDTIVLNDNLWKGKKSVSQVLDQFGSSKGGDFILNFGDGDKMIIKDTLKYELTNDVNIV